jgi:hypothetical protein
MSFAFTGYCCGLKYVICVYSFFSCIPVCHLRLQLLLVCMSSALTGSCLDSSCHLRLQIVCGYSYSTSRVQQLQHSLYSNLLQSISSWSTTIAGTYLLLPFKNMTNNQRGRVHNIINWEHNPVAQLYSFSCCHQCFA